VTVYPVTDHEDPEDEYRCSYTTISLTSALDAVDGKRHAPAASPLGKRPDTHFTGGSAGPRAGLDGCGKSRLQRHLIPGPSSSVQVQRI